MSNRLNYASPRKYSSLKSFKDTVVDGRALRAEESAYRVGKFLMATIFSNASAAHWCRSNGIAIQKAQGEGLPQTAGGYLVPEDMAASIITLRETFGVARARAQIVPMARDFITWPRRTSGVTANLSTEAQAITESQAAWDSISLTAKKLTAAIRMSSEVADDALVNLADWLTAEIAYQFAAKEDDILWNGDGTSTYGGITGLSSKFLTASFAGTFAGSAATFDALTATDIGKTMALLPGYALATARFYISAYGFGQLFGRLATTGGGVSMNGEVGPTHLGFPITIFQKMPAATPTGKIGLLFGDMAMAVALGDRRELTVRASDQRYLDSDQVVLIGSERFDINVHDVGDTSAAGPLVAMKMA